MKFFNFCKDEENFLIENCNFTDDELQVFKYKQKDYSIVKISILMGLSERTINSLVDKVANRIIRTLIIRAIINKSN